MVKTHTAPPPTMPFEELIKQHLLLSIFVFFVVVVAVSVWISVSTSSSKMKDAIDEKLKHTIDETLLNHAIEEKLKHMIDEHIHTSPVHMVEKALISILGIDPADITRIIAILMDRGIISTQDERHGQFVSEASEKIVDFLNKLSKTEAEFLGKNLMNIFEIIDDGNLGALLQIHTTLGPKMAKLTKDVAILANKKYGLK